VEPTTETVVVPAACGDLRARIWLDAPAPRPGLVLVDGSGDSAVEDGDDWARRLTASNAVVLGHDKPGCGGNPHKLAFLAGILDLEPAEILPRITCPVLALFGAADPLVPVPDSVATFARHLPPLPGDPHGLAVFPGADHGLFTAPSHPSIPRTDQLAAGLLPMITEFLHRAHETATSGHDR
jgi:pimeloyl-ACP methyl ester carboxylesterase